jgi:Protein of unknown function (DUF3500)
MKAWLLAGLVLSGVGGVCRALELAPPSPTARAMTDAARDFLGALSPEERERAMRAYDDPVRLDWHNIPKPERKGLQVRDMSAPQRTHTHALLRAALSPTGYEKAVWIMALEANLREGEKGQAGAPLRDPERYFLTIFGEPSLQGTWGWSFEGHHFSLNFSVREGQVIADTPSFWGANPATVRVEVPGGPPLGTRTLAQEEQLALDLMQLLDDAQRAAAIIAAEAPAEYRGGGEPQPSRAPPQGLAAQDMNDAQRDKLWSLLEVTCGNLTEELATRRLDEIRAAGLERVYLAWAGAIEPGKGHHYRIQGPTFVLELINVQADPAGQRANHIHSVWRDVRGDFGVAAP